MVIGFTKNEKAKSKEAKDGENPKKSRGVRRLKKVENGHVSILISAKIDLES